MKEIERKPWVRWLYLAWAVIWLINLICKLSHYFQQLDQGVSMERLADARFDCLTAGFITVIWLVSFCIWRMDQKKPVIWLVRLILLTVLFVGWAVTYPLAAASGYPPFFWWTILAVLAGITLYGVWKCFALKRKMISSEEDEII